MVTKIAPADFEREVLKSELPVIADFGATWCGPCKRLEPIIDQLAEKLSGKVKVVKVDVEENGDRAAAMSVTSVPTVVFLRNGEEQGRIMGMTSLGDLMGKAEDLFEV